MKLSIEDTKNDERSYAVFEVAIGGGSRNFKFDVPSHIPYVFLARVVNKIHNVNIVYWLKSKYMRVIQLKFTKTNPNFFQNGGARARRAGPGSAFDEKDLLRKNLKILIEFFKEKHN